MIIFNECCIKFPSWSWLGGSSRFYAQTWPLLWLVYASPSIFLSYFMNFIYLFIYSFCLTVYGVSQARGWIGAVAAGLRHSHSNTSPEPCLQPTPQLTQCWILNPLSEARVWVLMHASEIRFHWVTKGTPEFYCKYLLLFLHNSYQMLYLFISSWNKM